MRFRFALAAATLLAAPAVSFAQPIDGLYVGGGIGANLMQDENTRFNVFGEPSAKVDLKSHLGPAAALSVGWGFGNGLRAEVEGDYRNNPFYGSYGGITSAGGLEQKFGAMANVLYDFTDVPVVQPYLGIGAGYQWAKESGLHALSPVGDLTAATATKGDFAYQAIAGVAVPVPGAPGFSVTADYRFMGLLGDRDYGASFGTGAGAVPASVKMRDDYNHTVLIGFRYAFGAPPPPPPPAAPAPAMVAPSPISRSYIVFFDWDRADLTDRARQIVSEAAANSTKVATTTIEVNGYTDTSGTAKYNQGLSVRRAQAVAGELVKDGVPKNEIAITGFGETHLLVPTGPGVREPQNRRVEIILK